MVYLSDAPRVFKSQIMDHDAILRGRIVEVDKVCRILLTL